MQDIYNIVYPPANTYTFRSYLPFCDEKQQQTNQKQMQNQQNQKWLSTHWLFRNTYS